MSENDDDVMLGGNGDYKEALSIADVDWCTKGVITSIKEQKVYGVIFVPCFSPDFLLVSSMSQLDGNDDGVVVDWHKERAFATISTIEAAHKIRTRKLITLSEQYLIDCDKKFSRGFRDGRVSDAFDFIVDRGGGVYLQADYPYEAAKGKCKAARLRKMKKLIVKRYVKVPSDEKSLEAAVRKRSVAAYIDGIVRYKRIKNLKQNRYVVIVGFGRENGVDYWTCRNSWGKDWGEKGYFRLEKNVRDRRGALGIATLCLYSVLA
ncbi:ervatamin-B-like [Bidens hawaiensis]|uniref:ervatamin-B-like n=1 Tax=Bidens hawaiensis TaxID=980011 RepID=UPI004049C549